MSLYYFCKLLYIKVGIRYNFFVNGESGKAQSKLIMLSGDNTFYLSADTGSLLPHTKYDVESA